MSSNFKLLITTDTSNEIWSYTIKLCESIMLYIKAEILIVSFGGKPNKFQELEANALNLKILYTDYLPEKLDSKTLNEAENYLIQVANDFNPNILHLNHYLRLSDKVKCPIVLTGHGDLISLFKWTRTNVIKDVNHYKQVVESALNSANLVISTSRFLAECLFKEYNLKNKIKLIYNGVNIEPSGSFPESPAIIAEGNLNDRTKNINLLTKIADKLPDNIKIRVIGHNNNQERSTKRIEWLNGLPFDEKVEIFRKSSIFLALSSYETFGFSSMVSAYSNCAILANDIPIYRELWGDCACIYDRNNLNSLIRNLNNLIENEKILFLTAKNCQAKALSSFNLKRVGMEYINLYKNILQKSIASNKNSTLENKVEIN